MEQSLQQRLAHYEDHPASMRGNSITEIWCEAMHLINFYSPDNEEDDEKPSGTQTFEEIEKLPPGSQVSFYAKVVYLSESRMTKNGKTSLRILGLRDEKGLL